MIADCTFLWIAWVGMVIAWALAMLGLFFARKTIRMLHGS
jgi:hypothetical protein